MSQQVNRLIYLPAATNKELNQLIKRRTRLKKEESLNSPWNQEFFSFQKTAIYYKLLPKEQKKLVSLASQSLLEEAYLIEKAGIAVATKMIYEASSIEEAQIYALMVADESRHLQIFKDFVSEEKFLISESSLIKLLNRIISEASNQQIVYLVQIVLEGWGLSHYSKLIKSCQDLSLKGDLQQILKDEAYHHHAGLKLFSPVQLNQQEKLELKEYLSELFEMVKLGEVYLLDCLEKVIGVELPKEEKKQFLLEIESPEKTKEKIRILLKLINQPQMEEITQGFADKYLA